MEWRAPEGQQGGPYGGQHPGGAPPGSQWGDPSHAGQPPQHGTGQTNTKALLSLIFAVLGIFVIPLLGGIAAIILGNMAQQELRERPWESGHGMAKAGIIIGWVSVILVILVILLMMAFVGAIFSQF